MRNYRLAAGLMENTSQRRRDILASNLLFTTLALTLVASLIQSYLPNPLHRTYTLGSTTMLATVYLLRGMLYYAIRLGKLWAKKVLLAVFLFNVILSVIVYSTNPLMRRLAARPDELVPTIIVELLIVLALVLLFKKRTSQVA
jgi:hypothetical protein